jgi:fibronectin-binding autotransporter adhesin
MSHPSAPRSLSLSVFLAACASQVPGAQAQDTGWQTTSAGTYAYTDAANWVGGNINGQWDSSLTLAGSQTISFSGDTTLATGLSFEYAGSASETLRADGTGPATLTLGGDILVRTASSQTITIGSSSPANQRLDVDLGGEVRTFTVFGSGNGGNFGRTLDFRNTVSNGGVIASGGGSGGGLIRFSSASNTFDSLTVTGAEVNFNGAAVTTTNTLNTISGALTAGNGPDTVTLTAATSRNTLVQAGSFSREAGSTILFRGTNLGTNAIGTGTNSTNVQFTTAPTLTGGAGAAGSSTVSILAGAFGDTSATGSGFGATGGLVTYDSTYGVRLLDASEYTSAITDAQTQLDNVRYANSSGTILTTHLSSPLTTINSLSFNVTGATGNQGVSITGEPDAVLRVNSGVIYAYQNVTTGGNPATTDAIVLDVPTLDLNGQEGIILASTRFNTGGGNTSNAGLIINSTITNATGLTIGDGQGGLQGYVVLAGSGSNSYTGNTTVNGAAVRLGKSISNSIGDVVLNLGAIYNAGNQMVDTANLTIHGGTFYLNGSANSGSATNETINHLTMTGGGISSGQGNSNTLTVLGDLDMSGGTIALPVAAKLNVGGTTTLSGGVITIGRSSNATYNSKTTLSGPLSIVNTASGIYTPITIAAGTSGSVIGGQLELSGDVTFTGNAGNRNTVTIAAPTGAGPQGTVALDGTRTFTINNGAADVDLAIEAPIVDGTAQGGLVKEGAGTLRLEGDNTYTGATTVNAGTLLVNGTSVSEVTVTGGALGGTGTLSGGVTIGAGGTLTPGEGIGAVTVAGLSLSGPSATLAMEIGGASFSEYDQVNVTGGVSLDGNGQIEITLLSFVPQPSEIYFLILNDGTDAISGTLAGLAQGDTFASGGYTWQVSYLADSTGGTFTGGNDLAVQVVPEPTTGLLLATGLGALTLLRRNRPSRK